jgi:hypothetical protein
MCTCGCCLGLTAVTPLQIYNRPGRSAIAYRAGTQPLFKRSMLAALSSSDHPALAALGSRADDDFSIALLDAWATVADVLTFYQERIANESYLQTATERLSLLEMGRLIGYELRPGVAASTHIAFTLDSGPGSPMQTTIDPGVKVQSIPGPNEKPQTFETVAGIQARVEWNALTPRLTRPQAIDRTTRQLYLAGTDTQLQVGDGILVVGQEREDDPGSEQWDFRVLESVQRDSDSGHTLIAWSEPLGAAAPHVVNPANLSPRLFALRQRAALFGHNAPDPLILHLDATSPLLDHGQWKNFVLDATKIDLDAVYTKVLAGSWAVLVSPTRRELCRVSQVTSLSDSRFALSGKFTRIVPDVLEHASSFGLRSTTVFAQSEQLELVERPVAEPVYGSHIALGQLAPELAPAQTLALSGKRQRLRLTLKARNLSLTSGSGATAPVLAGDSLEILAPPTIPAGGAATTAISPDDLVAALGGSVPQTIVWQLRDKNGFTGSLTAGSDQVALAKAEKDDDVVSELAFIDGAADAVSQDGSQTAIQLRDVLANCYDRETVRINANVASATHGETVPQEVLGAGDASQTYQRFTLKQPPLTYVSASTASGARSTLEVRVNDLLWQEAPSLYSQGPRDRVYVTHTSDDGKTTVEFGDGSNGARLPSGADNVRAKYRRGIGLEGVVKAGQLSQLMTRPLGVKDAINPEAATGAANPESPADARRNEPLTVLTLDRAVSLLDYEDFARAFGGVAKARASWSWDGLERRVFVVVAGPGGAAIPQDSDTFMNLVAALASAGDPFVSFSVKSYRAVTFRLVANVKVDEPTYVRTNVMAAVEAALRERFSFEARSFGQPVVLSDVIAAMQDVAGVVAVDVNKLYRGDAAPALNTRLTAAKTAPDAAGALQAAELLTLDPAPLGLGVMT